MTDATTLSFAKDIRPMFTDMDVDHMQGLGMDLSDRASVESHAQAIYQTVSTGVMPPTRSGEAPWTKDMCERFKAWRDQGCPP